MKRRIVIVLGFLFALASTYAQTTRYFVYVANQNSSDVSAYSINATTGVLAAVVGSPFKAGAYCIGVAVDPTGQFV